MTESERQLVAKLVADQVAQVRQENVELRLQIAEAGQRIGKLEGGLVEQEKRLTRLKDATAKAIKTILPEIIGALDKRVTQLHELAVAIAGTKTVAGALELRERVKALESRPSVQDRGVFDEAKAYGPGDGVTHRGSWWLAQRLTLHGEKPGDTSGAFRMAVRAGRDGKDAR